MQVELLGARVDGIRLEQAVERTAGFIRSRQLCWIITLNPELLYRAWSEGDLLNLINRANLVTADGVGIVWACRLAGRPVPERVTGIDLMLRLAARAAGEGWRIFLLGAAPGVAGEAAARLERRYPGLVVAGTHHGYFSPAEEPLVVAQVRRARPDLLFVALGAPKQEYWIAGNLAALGAVVVVGVGGSFDVIAGRVRRAPFWMQRLRLEWLFRLLKEPARWRRMLVLPLFAWLVLKKYKLRV
ncbi:MAG: glycosyltransferase [Peptococcaceae bacterium]|nr:MAG: glycosyltransferase [Peptococcaceae bacterium]